MRRHLCDPSRGKAIRKTLKNPNVNRKISHGQKSHENCSLPPGGVAGGTSLFKVYRYVPPQRVWFLSRFGLKTGIDFDNYGLKSGRVFGAENIYESLQTYFSSQYVTGTTN